MLAKFYQYLWKEAYQRNDQNILSLLEKNHRADVVDIGCGDGQKTIYFKKKIGCHMVTGIDGVVGRLKAAKKRGIYIKQSDLEKKWPFPSDSFDVVVSNQVIEHISDIDHFIKEIFRILKPGGYCVISTENLSSWHNIFALILGHQAFSQTIISKFHVGNPFSLHFKEKTGAWSANDNSGVDDATFPHIKILTYRSLRAVFEAYNFQFIQGKGSGYYPLFAILGRIAAVSDPYHTHFITAKFRKPM